MYTVVPARCFGEESVAMVDIGSAGHLVDRPADRWCEEGVGDPGT